MLRKQSMQIEKFLLYSSYQSASPPPPTSPHNIVISHSLKPIVAFVRHYLSLRFFMNNALYKQTLAANYKNLKTKDNMECHNSEDF